MADGRWPMADGRWPMADGRWPMADGRWPMADPETPGRSSAIGHSPSEEGSELGARRGGRGRRGRGLGRGDLAAEGLGVLLDVDRPGDRPRRFDLAPVDQRVSAQDANL